ncbi:DNA polymerase III subunit alpha [Hufsiella ginkgonis]|uniref:DNA-directed DNA polymerase n=1 Tax=Hufsiella ginkgonis TaxID=2695274 RepID=A0A7K1XWI6_9SPHI|nr:DNA polymerase III subunit alpha [Hufsiella ginkgonis]MXV15148.1 DNA polymerase III subunit alpha [Hufsiella ginkgonis]
MYVNCKTYFSYRYGTYDTKELVKEAAALGVRAMALTNINGSPDAWDFVDFCREYGVKPILGCEIRNGHTLCYVLLARNAVGFAVINRFISVYKQNGQPFPGRFEGHRSVYVIYPLGRFQPDELGENDLIGVKPSEVNKLITLPMAAHPEKYVIRQPVTFQDKQRFNLHRLLRAIDLNTLCSKLMPQDVAGPEECFLPETELITRFREYAAMICRTNRLIEDCGIETELKSDKNKKTFSESAEDDRRLLRKLAYDGISRRYPKRTKEITDRIEKELDVINKMNFNACYLIVNDVIQYARSRNFFYVGRGSGANSIVAYLMGITDVDPIRFDLYFERFLNTFRVSPPDFDIDFSHRDRDEVIDYIFTRYGNDRVSLLGMYSKFKYRATIRELGKVVGLPKSEIDQLAAQRPGNVPDDRLHRAVLKYGLLLKNFPNYHSIHAGGILVSEEPIYTYTALEMPPKGFATSQVDMFLAEKVGLHKLDILSQRGLGHIKDTIQLVKQNRGISIDITRVDDFMTDEKVAFNIRNGNTIGCFYIESPAMRQLLTKLRCSDYLTLVAASSIIRPGVSQSGMMKQYIYNYHHRDQVKYLHPKMEELLKETYGIMVYQEDVIKVGHHFGGLNMAESDVLRRTMSGKYRDSEEMDKLELKFFGNCRKQGYPEHTIREVWRQMASFAGFSFSKAHSASFAVESYQSLYLKTYYPMEFMVGVINNFGGFYRTPFYFHELKRTGATLHGPCVNRSHLYTTINGKDVFTGFIHIEKLTDTLKEKIVQEREAHGAYLTLQDFIGRVQPGQELLNILIRAGALRFTGIHKKELLWKANFTQHRLKAQPAMAALFDEPEMEFTLPEFKKYPLEDALDELELLGFTIGNSFDLVDDDLSGLSYARELPLLEGKEVNLLGELVITKESWTRKNEYMVFGTFLDPHGDWMDTVHWPASINAYPFSGSGFYRMKGKVIADFGVYAVEVTEMSKVGRKAVY